MTTLPNIHPGEILQDDYLEPLGKTPYWLAKRLGMTPTAIGEILKGKRAITAATALRLGRFFDTSPEFWLNLQAAYDLEEARLQLAEALEGVVPFEVNAGDDVDEASEPYVFASGEPLVRGLGSYAALLPVYRYSLDMDGDVEDEEEDEMELAEELPLAA
jgi:antitoxin HigA-1